MNYIDYIIFAFLALAFILGYKDGFVRKIIGLVGLIAAIVLSIHYSETAGAFLLPVFGEVYLSEIIGGILIFGVIILVTSILKRVIHPLDRVNKFVNQILGGFTGSIQMLFFISGFLLFLNIFDLPKNEDRDASLIYRSMYNIIPSSIDLLFGDKSIAREGIKKFIEQKDKAPELDK